MKKINSVTAADEANREICQTREHAIDADNFTAHTRSQYARRETGV